MKLARLIVAAFLLAGSARAGEPAPGAWIGRHLLESARLLDDPGSLRGRLESFGVDLQLFYNQYVDGRPGGGAAHTRFGYSGSYDFFAHVDSGAVTAWQGLELLARVKGQYDQNINVETGALSDPVDDADFDEAVYLDELWLQQSLFRERVLVRIGFLEQQTVFDRNAFANDEDRHFLATFLDNDPVVPLPNGLAALLLARPFGPLELAFGVADADNLPRHAGFDTAFDGADSLTGYCEATLRSQLAGPRGSLPGRYRVGVFLDGRNLVVFGRVDAAGAPVKRRGHVGAYLSFDQQAFREDRAGDQGLGVFARVGYADEDVNRITWFWSIGLQYLGLLPGRDADVVGLAGYQALGSERYRHAVVADFRRESGIELYYRAALLPWLAVTSDLQYIVDPGASDATRNALLLLMRFRVTF